MRSGCSTINCKNTRTENARKYTQPGGNVSVYAQETESYVEISVKDDGPGLSQEDVERILSEKVYDSGKIGLQTSENVSELQVMKYLAFFMTAPIFFSS